MNSPTLVASSVQRCSREKGWRAVVVVTALVGRSSRWRTGSAEVAAGVDRASRGGRAGARCSATMLITPSLRSRRPRIVIAGASRATRRKRAQQPFDTTTLISPVSSSRLRNVVPWAVIGRWRWVTTPATVTRDPGATSHRPCDVTTPSSSSCVAQELRRVAVGRDAGGPQVGDGLLDRGHPGQRRGVGAGDDAGQPVRAGTGRRRRPPTAPRAAPARSTRRTARRWPSPPAGARSSAGTRRTRSSEVAVRPVARPARPRSPSPARRRSRAPTRSPAAPPAAAAVPSECLVPGVPARTLRCAETLGWVGLQRGRGQRGVEVGGAHDDAVAAGVPDQGVRAPEPHRLGVEQRRAERRRLVVLDPRRGVHEVGERHRVRSRGSRSWRTPSSSRTARRRCRR